MGKRDGSAQDMSPFWSHGLSVHFEIEVPTETRTEIHTGGGGITFPACAGQPM